MKRYKIVLIELGVLCAVLVGVSFYIGGTPISQRAINLDETRLNDFQEIKYQIDNYYRDSQSLPKTLDDLEGRVNNNSTDPETKQKYSYSIVSNIEYQLCTTFSTDSNETENDGYRYYALEGRSHIKGYDCIKHKIESYLISPTPTPYTVDVTSVPNEATSAAPIY